MVVFELVAVEVVPGDYTFRTYPKVIRSKEQLETYFSTLRPSHAAREDGLASEVWKDQLPFTCAYEVYGKDGCHSGFCECGDLGTDTACEELLTDIYARRQSR